MYIYIYIYALTCGFTAPESLNTPHRTCDPGTYYVGSWAAELRVQTLSKTYFGAETVCKQTTVRRCQGAPTEISTDLLALGARGKFTCASASDKSDGARFATAVILGETKVR